MTKAQRNETKYDLEQMQQWNNKRLDRLAEAAASGEYAGWEDQIVNRNQGGYHEEDEAPHEIEEEENGEANSKSKTPNANQPHPPRI
jgi:hypothetical protein